MAEIIDIDLNEHFQDPEYIKAMIGPDVALHIICNVFAGHTKIGMSIISAKKLMLIYNVIRYELDEYNQLFDQLSMLVSDYESDKESKKYVGVLYEDFFRLFIQDHRIIMTRDEFMPYNDSLYEDVTNDPLFDFLVGTAHIEEDIVMTDITFYNKRFFVKYFLSTIFVSQQLHYVYDLMFNNLEYFTAGDLLPLLQFVTLKQKKTDTTYFQRFVNSFEDSHDDHTNNLADVCDMICCPDNHFVGNTSKYKSMYDICLYVASFYKDKNAGKNVIMDSGNKNKKVSLTISSDQLGRNLQLTKELFYMGILGSCELVDYDFRNIVCRPNVLSENVVVGWLVSDKCIKRKYKEQNEEQSPNEDQNKWTDIRPRKTVPRYCWADLEGVQESSDKWSTGIIFTNDPAMIEPDDYFIMSTTLKEQLILHAKNMRHFIDRLFGQTNTKSFSDITVHC